MQLRLQDVGMFQCVSWKPIYFGVKRSRSRSTKHCQRGSWNSFERCLLIHYRDTSLLCNYELYHYNTVNGRELQYVDEAMVMRRKKQELARLPDCILPSSLLQPMPLLTCVPFH